MAYHQDKANHANKKYTLEDAQSWRELRRQGISLRDISKKLKISEATIGRIMAEYGV